MLTEQEIQNYKEVLEVARKKLLQELEGEGGIQPPLGRRRPRAQSRWGRRRQLKKLRRAAPES